MDPVSTEEQVKRMVGVVSVMSLEEYEGMYPDDTPVTDRTQWSDADFVPTPLLEKYPNVGLAAVTVAYPDFPEPTLVMVVNLETGYPVWENPANGGDSPVRYVALAVLAADAQNIEHG